MKKRFEALAYQNVDDLMFGRALYPISTRSGMEIGGGRVYPELNFTLPPMELTAETFPIVCRHYQEIVTEALKRAAALESPGVVLEFETLPPMTSNPTWAEDICRILLDGMTEAQNRWNVRSTLRVTPNDNREMIRPPVMRSGRYWDSMLETFERCAAAGAELLSIESVGGKEIHDDALTMCNMRHVIFALCVLGVRDMRFVWDHIVAIADRHQARASGDTACGFGNTAMVLAEQGMIPRVFAAVVRVVSAVRSLVAYERGAVGPGKDCGYENIILKAITGCPMSMEGKTAACAHLSPVGNIAAAACDLWSNESVQHIRLLGASAPTCYLESLEYDCRLINQALSEGTKSALALQRWMVGSDAHLDPQAFVLAPENAFILGREIVSSNSAYAAGRKVALKTIEIIRDARVHRNLKIGDRELPYLDFIQADLESMPDSEDLFISQMVQEIDTSKIRLSDYDIQING